MIPTTWASYLHSKLVFFAYLFFSYAASEMLFTWTQKRSPGLPARLKHLPNSRLPAFFHSFSNPLKLPQAFYTRLIIVFRSSRCARSPNPQQPISVLHCPSSKTWCSLICSIGIAYVNAAFHMFTCSPKRLSNDFNGLCCSAIGAWHSGHGIIMISRIPLRLEARSMPVLIHTPFHDNLGVNFRVIFLRSPSEYNAYKIRPNSYSKVPAQFPPLTFTPQQQLHNALNPVYYRGLSTPGPLTRLFLFPFIFGVSLVSEPRPVPITRSPDCFSSS